MLFNRESLAVYFILGSQNVKDKDPLFILEEALKGGISCFQFREKGFSAKSGSEKYDLARQMQKLCHQYRVPFFVNDDLELAINLNADGIHVGQDDIPVNQIREIAPETMKIGLSTTSVEEAIEAARLGVDYIGVGPIFPTMTKSDAKAPISLSGIQKIRNAVSDIPIVAIGGIELTDVVSVRKAGADGVAVISAISLADEPQLAAQAFVNLSANQ